MDRTSRKAAEQAYREAVRTAGRASVMGAIGFGLALFAGITLTGQGTLLAPGFGLEAVLLAGGLGGGLVFSVLAMRASRIVRRCQQALDEGSPAKRR